MDGQTIKLLPYKAIIATFSLAMFIIGGLLNVGADVIREQAQAEMIMSIPARHLSEIDVRQTDL